MNLSCGGGRGLETLQFLYLNFSIFIFKGILLRGPLYSCKFIKLLPNYHIGPSNAFPCSFCVNIKKHTKNNYVLPPPPPHSAIELMKNDDIFVFFFIHIYSTKCFELNCSEVESHRLHCYKYCC